MTMEVTTVLELLQLLANGIGVGVSSVAFVQTVRCYIVITARDIQNGRRVVARGHVRSEALRLAAQLTLVGVACISLFLMPAPPPRMPYIYWLSWRKTLVTLVSVFLTAQTLGEAYDRRQMDLVDDTHCA